MTSPYSGGTPPVGAPQGYPDPQGGYGTTPQGSYGTTPQGSYGTTPQESYGVDPQGGYTEVPTSDFGATSGAMGTPLTTEGRPDVGGSSVGQIMGEIAKDLSTLMRQELALAKVEVKAEATKAGKGAGLLGAAGFSGYMVLLFLSMALWWALENVMDAGLAALIVALLWAVVAAVTYVMGRKQLRKVNPKPEQTVDTLQQVPNALKPH